MKSFLASLAARAHGLAEVVQPRPRALFEPDALGNDGAVTDVPAAAPIRATAREASSVEMPLTRRIVEIEHLLGAAVPPTRASVPAVSPDFARPAAESVPPVPAILPAPEPSAAGDAPPVLPLVFPPAVPAAVQPVVHTHRAAPVSAVLPKSAAARESQPVPAAPPSVTIRIERIDVRAVTPAAPIARTIAAARRASAQPSLGDYLASRR